MVVVLGVVYVELLLHSAHAELSDLGSTAESAGTSSERRTIDFDAMIGNKNECEKENVKEKANDGSACLE